MGKVYEFKDIVFKIIAGDHLPPHVHVVKKSEKMAKITIDDQTVFEFHGFKVSELKGFCEIVRKYKEEFQKEWSKCNG